jgi:hypothetical protein
MLVIRIEREGAAGYAAFSNMGVKILVAGSGKGAGIAVNNKSKNETFMKMLGLPYIQEMSEDDLDRLGKQLFERHDRQQQRDHGDDRGGEEPHHIVG